MKKAVVIGWPISHSLSPRLHGFWLDKLGIEGSYEALPVEPENLGDFANKLKSGELGLMGANVTVPHKQEIMAFCDEISPLAKRIGAVNTLVVRDGKLQGSNTDHYGFKTNLEASGKLPETPSGAAIVLGAGGASRAVCTALEELGYSPIYLLNRTVERAEEVANDLGGSIIAGPLSDLSKYMTECQILVNSTSLGMKGQNPLDIDLSDLPKDAVVTDIVYNPLITGVLAQAKSRGNPIVDGIGMLLFQAIPGFESWFDPSEKPVVTEELRQHMLEVL
ncbi:shikimate dehydrogenase [Curvivirga sp.]|uniref:shikimate dehydrogenase n=1 Tax=Curvivirga sp. TaxID=2856848 RepID=UPI003B5C20D8